MPTSTNTRMTCKLAGAEVMVVSCLQKESLSQPFHVELEVYEHCLTMKKISYQDMLDKEAEITYWSCLLYTSPSPRDGLLSRMPSSA